MKPITNEVLCERLDNLIRDNSEDHEKILIQTTRTNGTVTVHSATINQLKGGLRVLEIIVIPIVIAIVINFIIKVL